MMLSPDSANWSIHPSSPLFGPPFPSTIIADPTVCMPEDSPDGKWHMYAHSLMGIHHFVSEDGIVWNRRKRVTSKALRPFLYHIEGQYFLYYEKILRTGILPFITGNNNWSSKIVMKHSSDLQSWSEEKDILVPSLSWHADKELGQAVSNPCLVRTPEGLFRLYYSASLVYVPDCGFNEPRFIGYGESKSPYGPFEINQLPVLSPDPANPYMNLGAGSIKVIICDNIWWGFQNGIYFNAENKTSGSALLLWKSMDGKNWVQAIEEPLLKPGKGWMKSHVYAVDAKYREQDTSWYVYFNARNRSHWSRGIERIGLLKGTA